MKIRFKTKDNIEMVKDCDIEEPVSVVMSPMWSGRYPERFIEYRRYEFRGEEIDGILTVVET